MTKGELIKRLIDEAFDDNTEVTIRLSTGEEVNIAEVSCIEDEFSETGHALRLHPAKDLAAVEDWPARD